MSKRTANGLVMASAGVAVLCLLIGVGSYRWFGDAVWESFEPVTRDWREFHLQVKDGRCTAWVARRHIPETVYIAEPPDGLRLSTAPAQAYVSSWHLWLFRYQHGHGPGQFGTSGFVEIGGSLLLMAAVAGVLPVGWRVQRRQSRRWQHEGRCPACGYDLRASQAGCPECGRPAPAPAAQTL